MWDISTMKVGTVKKTHIVVTEVRSAVCTYLCLQEPGELKDTNKQINKYVSVPEQDRGPGLIPPH